MPTTIKTEPRLKEWQRFYKFLEYNGACYAALSWVRRNHLSIKTAWKKCEDPWWLLWLAKHCEGNSLNKLKALEIKLLKLWYASYPGEDSAACLVEAVDQTTSINKSSRLFDGVLQIDDLYYAAAVELIRGKLEVPKLKFRQDYYVCQKPKPKLRTKGS